MKTFPTLLFQYRLSAINAVLIVLVALAVTAGIGHVAYTNPDTRITRVLSRMLSPEVTPAFFWSLTLLCLIATVYAIWFAIRSQTGLRHVELGPTGAQVPKASMSMKPITIPYEAITHVQIVNVQGQRMAVIRSAVGESRLLEKSFATPAEFVAFLQALQERRDG